ncbi:hypothetical protein OG552_09540 [Streptomyces sp. NBC_01476]|uniref:hypothetical protein n=1 Tax=Streptomyces sp. NBC_01476 TaxID=2903881 RepID=UPI002E307EAA|nr:hypothetical protein [Streptomyces sp. NBC_01476]
MGIGHVVAGRDVDPRGAATAGGAEQWGGTRHEEGEGRVHSVHVRALLRADGPLGPAGAEAAPAGLSSW